MFKAFAAALSIGIVFTIVILLIFAAIGAVLWPYAINAWLVFLGKPAAILWWHGALLGFMPFIGQLTIPFAFVTWILMMFLV